MRRNHDITAITFMALVIVLSIAQVVIKDWLACLPSDSGFVDGIKVFFGVWGREYFCGVPS